MSFSAFAEEDFAGSVQDGAAENMGKLTDEDKEEILSKLK